MLADWASVYPVHSVRCAVNAHALRCSAARLGLPARGPCVDGRIAPGDGLQWITRRRPCTDLAVVYCVRALDRAH